MCNNVKKNVIVLNKKEKKMNNPNIQLEDVLNMSVEELKKLSNEQVEELRRQYRVLTVQQTLGTLSEEQLTFLGFDPNNISDISEYSVNMNMINSPQVIKCSRYSKQSPNGVMLYNKKSGNTLNETKSTTSKNGRTQNKYWFANELIQSSNGLYSMQIQSDGDVVIFDNNMTEIWNLKETFPTFFPLESFETRDIESSGKLYIVEMNTDDIPFANTSLNPYIKIRAETTIKKYNPYGVRVNESGDLLFEAILTEEYADQTKDTYIIPYFIIRNSKKLKGPYEFLLNDNRVFEVRNETKESLYLTNTESYGILRQIPEDLYESLDIDVNELTTVNCKQGTVMKSEINSLRFNVNDFQNEDIIYDPVTKEYFRMYNYKLGLMTENILKTWYYPKVKTKAIHENYYSQTVPYEFVIGNYQTMTPNFTVSVIIEKKEGTVFLLSESFVISMKSNKIYFNDVEVSEVSESTTIFHFVWIQTGTMQTIFINGVNSNVIESMESLDVNFKIIQTFTKTSSLRMYPSSLSNEEVMSLYKNDIYSPGMKIKVKETYLFKKGKAYTPNSIDIVTKDSLVFFENDDSILFKYNPDESRFVRYKYNEFTDRDSSKIPIAVPYEISVFSSGDLLYDPVYLKYYRFYNNSIGEIPTSDVLMSWYDVELNSPLLFYKPNKLQKEMLIPEIQLGSEGISISFFLKTKMKNQKLFDFGEDLRSEIIGDVFYVNDFKIYKRITNNETNHIVIEILKSGRVDIYVNANLVSQENGKLYPTNIKRKYKIIHAGLIDFRIYTSVLPNVEIEKLYTETIFSPVYNRMYVVDTRKLPKGNTYEFLEKDAVSSSIKILSIDDSSSACEQHCKALDCKKYEIAEEGRCNLYETSEIIKPKKLRYIYIENDKSKTYDLQTKLETSTKISNATPMPYNKFTPTTTTTSESESASLQNSKPQEIYVAKPQGCPIQFWRIVVISVVVALIFYLIKKMFQS